jgi:hypothetical protein
MEGNKGNMDILYYWSVQLFNIWISLSPSLIVYFLRNFEILQTINFAAHLYTGVKLVIGGTDARIRDLYSWAEVRVIGTSFMYL